MKIKITYSHSEGKPEATAALLDEKSEEIRWTVSIEGKTYAEAKEYAIEAARMAFDKMPPDEIVEL